MTRALFAAAALVLAAPVDAAAFGPCTSPEQMAAALMMYHREFPIGTIPGVFPSEITIFASDAGSWTVVQVIGDKACVIETGDEWAVPTSIHGDGV